MKRVLTIPVSDIDRINDILQEEGITSSDIVKINQVGNHLRIVTGTKWWGSGGTPAPSFNRTFWFTPPEDVLIDTSETTEKILRYKLNLTSSLKFLSVHSGMLDFMGQTSTAMINVLKESSLESVTSTDKKYYRIQAISSLDKISLGFIDFHEQTSSVSKWTQSLSSTSDYQTLNASSFYLKTNEDEANIQNYTTSGGLLLNTSYTANVFHTIFSGSAPSTGEFIIYIGTSTKVSTTSLIGHIRIKIGDTIYNEIQVERARSADIVPYNKIIVANLNEGDLVEIQLKRNSGTLSIYTPSIIFLKKSGFRNVYHSFDTIFRASTNRSTEWEDAYTNTFNIENPNNLHLIILNSEIRSWVNSLNYGCKFKFVNKTENVQYGETVHKFIVYGDVYRDFFVSDIVTFNTGSNELALQYLCGNEVTTFQAFANNTNMTIIDLGITQAQYNQSLEEENNQISDFISENYEIAYSLRLLNPKYTGSCLRIRRDNDDEEIDVGFINGYLNTSSILSFVESSSAYVTTWYDQSGYNNHAIQNDPSVQPYIVSSGSFMTLNDKICIQFDDNLATVEDHLVVPVYHTATSPFIGIFSVMGLTSNGAFPYLMGGGNGDSGIQIGFNSNSRTLRIIASRTSGTPQTWGGTALALSTLNLVGLTATRGDKLSGYLNGINILNTNDLDGTADIVLPTESYYLGNRGGDGGVQGNMGISEFIVVEKQIINALDFLFASIMDYYNL